MKRLLRLVIERSLVQVQPSHRVWEVAQLERALNVLFQFFSDFNMHGGGIGKRMRLPNRFT